MIYDSWAVLGHRAKSKDPTAVTIVLFGAGNSLSRLGGAILFLYFPLSLHVCVYTYIYIDIMCAYTGMDA